MAVGVVVLRTVGLDMLRGLALVAVRGEWNRRWGGVWDDDRLSLSSGFHNYFQSSRESDLS